MCAAEIMRTHEGEGQGFCFSTPGGLVTSSWPSLSGTRLLHASCECISVPDVPKAKVSTPKRTV